MLSVNRTSGDCRGASYAGAGRRLEARSELRRRAWIGGIAALVAFAVWLLTAASAFAFKAEGSAEQVYVTGLAPNAQTSLLSSSGATVYTQNADSLGRPAVPERGSRARATGFA